jgi:hypothetical protein
LSVLAKASLLPNQLPGDAMKPVRTLLTAAIAALSLNAHAVTVPTDGSWIQFDFDSAGSSLYDLSTLDTGFTFTLSQSSILSVVDLGFSGDRFNIFANGVSLGLTSAPVAQAANEDPIFDIPTALNDNRFSKGNWNLAKGNYTITGIAKDSPFDGGYGALSVVAVPEPESWALLLAGLGIVGTIARRRSLDV